MNFKLTLKWLARWKILWWFLAAIAGSVLIADWLGCRAEIPRHERLPYAGWFLDMLGVAVVFLSIAERLVLFEKDGLLARAKKLLREFPLFRRNVHIAAGTGKLSFTGGRASVRTTVSPPAEAAAVPQLRVWQRPASVAMLAARPLQPRPTWTRNPAGATLPP